MTANSTNHPDQNAEFVVTKLYQDRHFYTHPGHQLQDYGMSLARKDGTPTEIIIFAKPPLQPGTRVAGSRLSFLPRLSNSFNFYVLLDSAAAPAPVTEPDHKSYVPDEIDPQKLWDSIRRGGRGLGF
jgi:hypothetical protein